MKNYFVLLFVLLTVSCKNLQKTSVNKSSFSLERKLTNDKLATWYQNDYYLDNTPGISLEKWYKQNKEKPLSKEIIVAVIDTQIDTLHEDLQGQLWSNPNEIPNNGLDDDSNGYIDDCDGWNFTSNNKGDYVVWGNFEYVRLIREWDALFKDKIENQITPQQIFNYKEYKRALKTYEDENSNYKNWLTSSKYSEVLFPIVKDSLKHYFPKEDYTYEQLDSLYEKYKINDKTFGQRRKDDDRDIGAMAAFMKVRFDYDEMTIEKMRETVTQLDSIVNKNINIDFNERLLIGDNPKELEKGYGSNNISISKTGFQSIQDHGTKVSGIIAATRNNDKGIKGIVQNVKIMPLNISFSGDEHDKDIAMAIRYAVDNGAKVINMSFGKEFSLKKEWVFDAMKYAEKNNVLLIHCSGNNGFNVDKNPYYPSDNSFDGSPEVCNNFINVGSISSRVDSTFVSNFSNYGKRNVDLFAPGEDIYTTSTGNTYATDSGTSLAGPMVSGTAALIWSYYPNFSAVEVKKIIIESGSSYNIEVILPGTKDKKVPFSELSKSGRVLNVYNAMKLAEKCSKLKRR